jgi:hypothetical protein
LFEENNENFVSKLLPLLLTAPLLSYKYFEESFFKLSTTNPSFPASPANAYPRWLYLEIFVFLYFIDFYL